VPITYFFWQKTKASRKHLFRVLRLQSDCLFVRLLATGKQPFTLADALRLELKVTEVLNFNQSENWLNNIPSDTFFIDYWACETM
jgi:hypothetical protein